ncbi:MAG: hypothetical protein FWC91_14460 [Defluviitaleaceae bacterium]|nr:hypothetical protein [Defluviitaleaceae bacterium]
MLLVVRFDGAVDIIDVPEFIIANIEDYRKQFLNWLGDENIDHDYWTYENGVKYGLSFRSNAFVEWLNTFPLSNTSDVAKTVETFISEYDRNLSSIFF